MTAKTQKPDPQYEALLVIERKRILARNAQIAKALTAGETYAAIAARYDITRQRVDQIRRAEGIPSVARRRMAEKRKQIVAMARAGLRLAEIAAQVGYVEGTVRAIVCRAGIKLRHASGSRTFVGPLVAAYLGLGGLTGTEIATKCSVLSVCVFGIRAELLKRGVPLPTLPDGRVNSGRRAAT